jgi:hypothetical protein
MSGVVNSNFLIISSSNYPNYLTDSQTNLIVQLVVKKQIAYNQFQYMKEVEGSLQFAELNGVPIYVLNGTAYLNQGLPNSTVTYGIRVCEKFNEISLKSPIVAASTRSEEDSPSDFDLFLVMLKDHTFLSGRNPLTGINDDRWGERFPDVSDCYCKQLMSNITDSAKVIYFNATQYLWRRVL